MSTDENLPYCNPEIWGGIECTINRVENRYRDQLQLADHYNRPGDIERFAQLGIRKLRYPVLWEHHQPRQHMKIDWTWTSAQLNRIRKNKMVPVAGLLHHGSGPVYTDLLDESFPEKLAAYACKVASRFPWLMYYTPVNEPLTTARFSGLYGFWYPHHTDERSFIKMLLNEIKGIVLAMKAIRRINPLARLVQTEDLARTHSTPLLQYQAGFENERRWLTYDLLCGKVNELHFFWDYFISLGIKESRLQFFLDNTCPPSIAGFNHYVTSERYLDEKISNYPACKPGGNGRHMYVDTEAVQTGHSSGIKYLLKEAWQRYQLPMAITECHLNCTREEQLRWMKEAWEACCALRKEGADIRAMTAWALLGSYDWNSLLTKEDNHYEPGIFDCVNDSIRATSLASMVRAFSKGAEYDHPLLAEKGWWHRSRAFSKTRDTGIDEKKVPLLILGKTGTLGHAFTQICRQRSIPFVALGRADVDILDESGIRAVIEEYKPWAVINATGYVRVDEAELYPADCYAVNSKAPAEMARLCQRLGIRFVSFSSDLVFDGSKRSPYFEPDAVFPLNVYGASKAQGEKWIIGENDSALIIRTSTFFGPWDRYNFVCTLLDTFQRSRSVCMPCDVTISPTYVPDLCHKTLDLLIDEEKGIWHLSNDGMATWAELAGLVAERAHQKQNSVLAKPLAEMGWKASRPLYSVLQSNKGVRLPSLENALDRYFEQLIA